MPDPVPSVRSAPLACAIVVAAGAGRRMGAPGNKVLLLLDDATVLAHTLRALARPALLGRLVLVIRPAERTRIEDVVASLAAGLPEVRYAEGGAERADSVRSGVAAAGDDAAILLVHDAARPFVAAPLLRALVEGAARDGAAVPLLPVIDTLKRVAGERVVATIERAGLARAQTPQAFRASVLRDALARWPADAPAPTDDAALVEALGRPVTAVPGDPLNLKITTPNDLERARALLPLFARREGLR